MNSSLIAVIIAVLCLDDKLLYGFRVPQLLSRLLSWVGVFSVWGVSGRCRAVGGVLCLYVWDGRHYSILLKSFIAFLPDGLSSGSAFLETHQFVRGVLHRFAITQY